MILIALGSNLHGNYDSSEAVLEAAYVRLKQEGIEILKKSSVYITEPVPKSDQPWFRNAVAQIKTDLSPENLLYVLKQIEREFGREDDVQNAARILDLDILAYNTVHCTENAPLLPHPRLHIREFVLFPLRDIVPDWTHPVLKRTVLDMIMDLKNNPQVHKNIENMG